MCKQGILIITWVFFLFSLLSCETKKASQESKQEDVTVPHFNADSAYYFVERQVKFGPRIPGTKPHHQTANFIRTTAKKYGGVVQEEDFVATTFDGKKKPLKNIMITFGADKKKRVLLAAHWDTRPFADKDEDQSPFEGANDGASGVGVLLEVARHVGVSPPTIGIDIVFFDGEDWGEPEGTRTDPLPEGLQTWWCLGSQYWAKNAIKRQYSAYYGIVLDMVGAKDSQFYREGRSMDFAPSVVNKVWNHAHALGFSSYFVKQTEDPILDDHEFINTIAHVPTINIVHFQPGLGYFGDYHHTHKDNMSLISKETLYAVGQTVLRTIYFEK